MKQVPVYNMHKFCGGRVASLFSLVLFVLCVVYDVAFLPGLPILDCPSSVSLEMFHISSE
jgi:hypothetical protein